MGREKGPSNRPSVPLAQFLPTPSNPQATHLGAEKAEKAQAPLTARRCRALPEGVQPIEPEAGVQPKQRPALSLPH